VVTGGTTSRSLGGAVPTRAQMVMPSWMSMAWVLLGPYHAMPALPLMMCVTLPTCSWLQNNALSGTLPKEWAARNFITL
jgi:hypothetical protein